jgi:hypothetical protein
VHVIYGGAGGLSAGGLSTPGDQVFHQDSTGMNDTAEEDDRFGEALAG